MKKTAMGALWNIAKDVGWGVLYQIGGVLSFVQDSASSFVDKNISHNDASDEHWNSKKKEGLEAEQSNHDPSQTPPSSLASSTSPPSNDNAKMLPSLTSSSSTSSSSFTTQKTKPKMKKSQPIHSVLESYSSLSSLESDLAQAEKESYIHDFVDMLKKGLYVFAWCTDSTVIRHSSSMINGVTIDDTANPKKKNKEQSRRKYQLRVLKLYETSSMNGYNDRQNNDDENVIMQSFLLSPVESRLEEEGIDIISFNVSDISGVRESRRGIQFMTKHHHSSSTADKVAGVDKEDEEEDNDSIISTSPSSKSSIYERKEDLVAEIVLSDDQDKDILLFGLNIFLAKVNEESIKEEEIEQRNDLDGDHISCKNSIKRNNSFETIEMNSVR